MALGRPGDVLVLVSGSGQSRNLVLAAERATAHRMAAVCLVGNRGSALAQACDLAIHVPSPSLPVIQQVHLVVIHAVCLIVEDLLGDG